LDGDDLANDIITLAKMASGTDGNIISYDASGNPVAIATGSDGQVLTSAGAGQPCAFETLTTGKVIQVVNVQSSTTATGTTVIPNDDTIPQITEGVEYLTLAITPTSSSNKLIVEWVIGLHASAETTGIVQYSCLFNTDIHSTNALACVGLQNPIGNNQNTSAGRYYVTAPGTSATTFRLRAGNSTTDTYTFNGAAGSSRLSTACVSSITITEIAV
jgi:hypothetical protein